MKGLLLILFVVYHQCHGRALEEEDSVVSVYTTQPTMRGPHPPPLDVYHQIASNIADRITSPIYRFLGIGKNKTEEEKHVKRSWEKIEILDDGAEDSTKHPYNPVDNDIAIDRDVEELSVEALKKLNKPEKVTLYSSYLPAKSNLESLGNDTAKDEGKKEGDGKAKDDDDDSFTLDDVEHNDDDIEDDNNQGFFSYVYEILSSIVQLAWGGITALFSASSSPSTNKTTK